MDRIEPYGVFVVFPGGRGLVPASETGTERGTDLKRHFQLGQALKAQILEVDATGKIRLSLTAAERAAERAEMEAWQRTQRPSGRRRQGLRHARGPPEGAEAVVMAEDSSAPVVVITGASAGIGAALARELAGRHASLVLIARREEVLRELAATLGRTGGGRARAT